MTWNLSRLQRDDAGFGMVLVLGMGAILTGLMVVSTTTALRSLESSRQHVNFEGALGVADGGVDVTLARAQTAYDVNGADLYLTPSVGDASCNRAAVAWPFTSQPTAEQERSWARTELLALAADPACRQSTVAGDYAVLKPAGRQTVYSMGWTPRYGAGEVKQRLLKAEYLFVPYRPTHAILTSGSLELSSSTTVTSAPPNDPLLAAVHTNGTLLVAEGNPAVYGPVTQSAPSPSAESNKFYGNTGGDVIGKAKQNIPFKGALAVWGGNHTKAVPGGWYDLCPEGASGTVREANGTTPCAGSVLATVSGSTEYRGWRYTSGAVPTWSATSNLKDGQYSGTYYAHHSNVTNPASNAGAAVPNLTIIASASSTTCSKVGGNIEWGSSDVVAPSLANTFLIADQDLTTTSNYKAGYASGTTVISGFFIAGDQISMSTSSSGAYGAVISADQCDPANGLSPVDSNTIQNPSIFYDPNAQAPFTDIINNTLWLEYAS